LATGTKPKLNTKVKLQDKKDLGDGRKSKTFAVINQADEGVIGYVVEVHENGERVGLQAVMADKQKTTIAEDREGNAFTTRAKTVTAVRRAYLASQS
jgi:hypothetical protein